METRVIENLLGAPPMTSRRIAIYYEHPDWFRPLFAELDARGLEYVKINASCHSYDPAAQDLGFALFFNRMSASAYLRGNAQGIFFTHAYLAHLDTTGVRVINGSSAFALETSKALQLQLMHSLSIPCPKTSVVNCNNEILAEAAKLGFPLLIKPNIGGRGAGIMRFDSVEELRAAINKSTFGQGVDQVALVQELIPMRDGHITRVETLGGKFLYAIDVFTSDESFNLCPAEICLTEGVANITVRACTPPSSVIEAVENMVAVAGIETGSVEYLIDDRDGRTVFYDINALSNFVADATQIVGFDPHARLVDYLEEQLSQL